MWFPGGTVDITVHETQRDGSVRELFKANGGPWGGTKIDEEFLNFFAEIAGQDVLDEFQRSVLALLMKTLRVVGNKPLMHTSIYGLIMKGLCRWTKS